MNPLTLFVVLALAATIYSLVCGIASMAFDHDVQHASSETWMWRRVGFQAATAVLVVAALAIQ
jgi:FlaG/FlaF family flagellin (archaellin)